MLRKVLSVLVICCFMFTNVCFAMPAAAGVQATVDNMALKSFLVENKGDISLLDQADMNAFATVLTALTGENYNKTDAANVLTMWQDNVAQIADKNAVVKTSLNNLVEKMSKYDANTLAERAASLEQDANGNAFVNTSKKLSSRIKNPEVAAELDAMVNENKKNATAATDTDSIPAGIVENLKDTATEADIAKLQSNFKNADLYDFDPAVIDMDNRVHGESEIGVNGARHKIYIDKNLTGKARIDMIIHELLHIDEGNEANTMGKQMALYNVKTKLQRQRDSQMADTRTAMEQSAQKVIDAKEAKSPSSKMSLEQEFVKADPKDPATQAKAMEIIKKVFPNDMDKFSKVAPEVIATKMQELGLEKIKAFVDGIDNGMAVFMATVLGYTSEVDQAELITKQAAGLKDGEVLAMDFNMTFTTSNGKVVPRLGAAAAFEALSNSNVKPGAIQVISAGKFAQEAQAALAFLYPNLGEKVNVIAGNESTLAVVDSNPELLRVLYSSTASIQGNIAKVSYILAPNLDKVNGLQVIIAALSPNLKSLSASEQSILSDLGNGKFELKNIAIDDAAYAAMQADYKTVVDILIQA